MVETQYTLDVNLQLEDGAAAATSTEVGQVGGSDKILDTGSTQATPAQTPGALLVDVSAIVTNDADELYTLILQGSNSASFASGIANLATIEIGAAASKTGGADGTDVAGRFVVPFRSDFGPTHYRYLRLQKVIAGTTPSITCTAYLVKRRFR